MSNTVIILLKEITLTSKLIIDLDTFITVGCYLTKGSNVNNFPVTEDIEIVNDLRITSKSTLNIGTKLIKGSILRVVNSTLSSLQEDTFFRTTLSSIVNPQEFILTELLSEIMERYAAAESREEIEALENKVIDLNNKYITQQERYQAEIFDIVNLASEQKTTLTNRVQQLQTLYSNFQEQLRLKDQNAKALKTEILRITEENEAISYENKSYEEKIDELVNMLNSLGLEKDRLENENANISIAIVKISNGEHIEQGFIGSEERDELQRILSDKEQRIEELRNAQAEITRLIEENENCETKNESNEEQINYLNDKISSIQEARAENEQIIMSLTEKSNLLKTELDNFVKKRAQNLMRLNDLEKEHINIIKSMSQIKEDVCQEDNLSNNVQEQMDIYDSLESKTEEIKCSIEFVMKKISEYEVLIEEKDRQIHNINSEKDILQKEIVDLNKFLESSNIELAKLTSQISDLKESINEKSLINEDLIKERILINQKLEELESENIELYEKLETAGCEIDCESLHSRVCKNNDKLTNLCKKQEELQNQISSYIELTISLRERLNEEINAGKKKDEIIEDYTSENCRLRRELKESIKNVVASGISLRVKNEELKSMAMEICRMREEINVLIDQLKYQDEKIKCLDEAREETLTKLSELRTERNGLLEDNLELTEEYNKDIANLNKEVDELQDIIRCTRIKLMSLIVDKNQCVTDSEDLLVLTRKLESEISARDCKIADLIRSKEELCEKYESTLKDCTDNSKFQEILKTINTEIDEFKTENDVFISDLVETNKKRQCAIESIRENENNIIELQERINSLLEEGYERDCKINILVKEKNCLFNKIKELNLNEKNMKVRLQEYEVEKQINLNLLNECENKLSKLSLKNAKLVEQRKRTKSVIDKLRHELRIKQTKLDLISHLSGTDEYLTLKTDCENLLDKVLTLENENEQCSQQILETEQQECEQLGEMNNVQRTSVRISSALDELKSQLEAVLMENKILKNSEEYLQESNKDNLLRIAELSGEIEEINQENLEYISNRVKLTKEKSDLIDVINNFTEELQAYREDSISLRIKFQKASEELTKSIENEYELSKKNKKLMVSLSQKTHENEILKIRYEDVYRQLICLRKETKTKDRTEFEIVKNMVNMKSEELQTIAKVMDSMIKNIAYDIDPKCNRNVIVSELSDIELNNLKQLKQMRNSLKSIRSSLCEFSPETITKDIVSFFVKMGLPENDAKSLAYRLTKFSTWTSEDSIYEVNDILEEINLNLTTSEKFVKNLCSNESEEEIIDKLMSKMEDLREQNQQLRGSIQKSQQRRIQLEQSLSKLEKSGCVMGDVQTIERLTNDLKNCKESKNSIKDLLTESNLCIKKLKAEKIVLEEKIRCLTKEIADNCDQSVSDSELMEQNEFLKSEIVRLQKEAEEYEDFVLNKITNLLEKNKLLEEGSSNTPSEEFLQQIIEYHTEITYLKEKLRDCPNKVEFDRLKSLVDSLLKQIEEKDEQIRLLTDKESCEDFEELQIKLNEKIEQSNKLNEILEKEIEKGENYSTILEEKDSFITVLRRNVMEALSRVSELNDEIDELTNLNTCKTKEIVSLVSKLKIKKNETEILKDRLELQTEKIEKLQVRISLMSQQKQRCDDSVENLLNEVKKLEEQKDNTVDEIKDLVDTINKFASTISELRKEIELKCIQVDELQTKISNYENSENDVKHSNKVIDSLQSKILFLIGKFKKYEEESISIIEDIKESDSKKSSKIEEINKMLKDNEDEISELKCLVEKKSKRVNALQEMLSEEEQKIKELSRTKTISQEKIDELNHELNKKNLKIVTLQSDVEETYRKVTLLEKQSLDSKDIIKDLNNKLWSEKINDNKEEAELYALKNEIERKNNMISELDEKLSVVQSRNKNLSGQVESMKSKENELRAENEKLKEQLASWNKSNNDLKKTDSKEFLYISSVYEYNIIVSKLERARRSYENMKTIQIATCKEYELNQEDLFDFMVDNKLSPPKLDNKNLDKLKESTIELGKLLGDLHIINDNLDLPQMYQESERDIEFLRREIYSLKQINGEAKSEINSLIESLETSERIRKNLEEICEKIEESSPSRLDSVEEIKLIFNNSIERGEDEINALRIMSSKLENLCFDLIKSESSTIVTTNKKISSILDEMDILKEDIETYEHRIQECDKINKKLNIELEELREYRDNTSVNKDELNELKDIKTSLENTNNFLMTKVRNISDIMREFKITNIDALKERLEAMSEECETPEDSHKSSDSVIVTKIKEFLKRDMFNKLTRCFSRLMKIEKNFRDGTMSIKDLNCERTKLRNEYIDNVIIIEDFLRLISE